MIKKRKYGPVFIAKLTIAIFCFVAAFAPFMAGDSPIVCLSQGSLSFPALSKAESDRESSGIISHCLMPLIPYHPQNIDKQNQSGTGPFSKQNVASLRQRHWLGTDNLGRDVASGLIHGTSTAMKIGLLSVFVSLLLGIPAGMAAGYYKNHRIRFNIPGLLTASFFLLTAGFYLIYELLIFRNLPALFCFVFILLITVCAGISKIFLRKRGFRTFYFPLDTLLVKIIELRKSLPGLFILLAMTCIFTVPSVWNVVLIISLLSWTEFARYARAETLAVSEENYIKSAAMLGISDAVILFRHILPNILPTIAVIACFGMAGAVMTESALSFLGIGLPVEEVTWGKMMAEGRNMRSWWLVVFPGLAIFILILCLSILADHYSRTIRTLPAAN